MMVDGKGGEGGTIFRYLVLGLGLGLGQVGGRGRDMGMGRLHLRR